MNISMNLNINIHIRIRIRVYIYMGHGQYLVYSSKSSFFEECIIVFQVLGIQQMLSLFEECIIVFQAPAQFPKQKMSRILLSITLNFSCNSYICIYIYICNRYIYILKAPLSASNTYNQANFNLSRMPQPRKLIIHQSTPENLKWNPKRFIYFPDPIFQQELYHVISSIESIP